VYEILCIVYEQSTAVTQDIGG